jgi:regulatory protein
MHTAHEIREGLSRRGFKDGVIADIVEDLSRLGYINDLEFTRAWITSRSAHHMHGRLRLLRDMRQKGIPDEMSESVFGELLTDDDEVRIAIKAAEKKQRTMKTSGKRTGRTVGRSAAAKNRESIYRYLRSRGFTSRVINLAMAGITFEEDPT